VLFAPTLRASSSMSGFTRARSVLATVKVTSVDAPSELPEAVFWIIMSTEMFFSARAPKILATTPGLSTTAWRSTLASPLS
jgi:hypothetical protein